MSSKAHVVDPLFRSLQPTSTGFLIWRIENMTIAPVPADAFGKFYSGDSYIVFSSSPYGTRGGVEVKAGNSPGRVEQHIHFWLGDETSQDEAAIAAYKTVELDEHLGGYPIQHREVQGNESKRFLAYFKNGIRYLKGGVKSGFNHYVEDTTPHLYQVKGKRSPIIRQLPAVSWSQINAGDAFVLDVPCHKVVFVWNGKSSNRFERLQASKFAQTLKTEHGDPDTEIVLFMDGDEETGTPHGHIFAEQLPLEQKAAIQDAKVAPDEDDTSARGKIKLYQCSENDGKLKLTEVKDGPLVQEDLKSDDSFLLDHGNYGIWVWIGKRASEGERREAMRNGQGFIKAKNYNSGTPVTRVIDGGEPTEFKSLFKTWKDKDQTTNLGRKYSTGPGKGVARTIQTKFDAQTLHEHSSVAADTGMVDDGTGVKEVFRVEGFDLVPVPEEQHGIFFSGDCYVVLYMYQNGQRDNYIIYYWLGHHSKPDEQGTAALRTVELDDRLGGLPVQVRVVQGKEPVHFMSMFGGHMTIYQGGKASAFDGEGAKDVSIPSSYLLQVRGSSRFNTKAIHEELRAASLNTNDCFVLVTPEMTAVWFGKGSTGDEREMAKLIANKKSEDPEFIFEGQEKAAFWEAMGGKEPYVSEKILKQEQIVGEPRLFQCSNATGNIKVDEIFNFDQSDLVEEDVMLLDAFHTIFIWLGRDSNKIERQEGMRIAKDYLETSPAERDHDSPVIIIKQGREPPNFTGFFGAWDEMFWGEPEEVIIENGEVVNEAGEVVVETGPCTYQMLTSEQIPDFVDITKKEEYLNDEEFEKVFEMGKEQFGELPAWRKKSMKQKKNLF